MLDTAIQRNPLKSDSMVTDNRHSPKDASKSQGGEFESMLANQTQETKTQAGSKQDTPSTMALKDKKRAKSDMQAQASQAKSSTPFEFQDSMGGESKIGLQEKISKNTKENAKPQDNPLAQILSSPPSQGITESSDSKLKRKESKSDQAQNPLAKTLPFPSQKDSVQASKASNVKTLADVESFAKQKGLNPGKITLETEGIQDATQSVKNKPKGVPISAKEEIAYEYENNTDRIAIVQRGVRKPKNITSKISNEYPVKSIDEDAEVGKAFSKERPPLSQGQSQRG